MEIVASRDLTRSVIALSINLKPVSNSEKIRRLHHRTPFMAFPFDLTSLNLTSDRRSFGQRFFFVSYEPMCHLFFCELRESSEEGRIRIQYASFFVALFQL